MYLDPRLLLGLKALVAASSKRGPHAPLTPKGVAWETNHDTRQRRMLATLHGLAPTASAVK